MQKVFSDGCWVIFGKSTETKPTPEKTDPTFEGKAVFFFEIDTKACYIWSYDDTPAWVCIKEGASA